MNKSFTLPSGIILKNKIVKSAMSENMATDHIAGPEFVNSYRRWSAGGAGLLITGNVMVDENQLGEYNNIVLNDKFFNIEALKRWAKAGQENNTKIFMQINHPGKQTPKMITKLPVAPSAISFPPPMDKMFNCPKELSEIEIESIINAFGKAAKLAMDTGFDGVQIHGAHGYLVSQFLSPNHNQRKDSWGGSLEKRMNFLISVYKKMRQLTGPQFGIAIKLNSADFQKGGFTEEESIEVVKMIDKLGMDFIEISGGTYQTAVMMGEREDKRTKSTIARESYFLAYAQKIQGHISTPLMVTGGFRTKQGINAALKSDNIQLAGLARPFCVYPDLVNRMNQDDNFSIEIGSKKLGVKFLDAMLPMEILWYTYQIQRMGNKQTPRPKLSSWKVAVKSILSLGIDGLKRVRT